MQNKCIIGLDLGGTKLAGALFKILDTNNINNQKLDLLDYINPVHYKELLHSKNGKKINSKILTILKSSILSVINDFKTKSQNCEIIGIGIASAGFIENDIVVDAKNIGMKNFPLKHFIESNTGIKTFLFKDSRAPVFIIPSDVPSIIFSLGTGFGGVSCEPNFNVPLLSYTITHKILWLPYLYCNDDPGFAISFSKSEIIEKLYLALKHLKKKLDDPKFKKFMRDIFNRENCESDETLDIAFISLCSSLWKLAKNSNRISPPLFEYLIASCIAPKIKEWVKINTIFADFFGSAVFPLSLCKLLCKNNNITPQQLDEKILADEPCAVFSFLTQAEFIACIIFKMQMERKINGLEPVENIYGTGSGFNTKNYKLLNNAIIESFNRYVEKSKGILPKINGIKLLTLPQSSLSTATYGAAMGVLYNIGRTANSLLTKIF